MTQELPTILDARERQLQVIRDELYRRWIYPVDRELAQIAAARAAIKGLVDDDFDALLRDDPHERLTYEQLAVKVLTEHFPNGATTAEMVATIGTHYGRLIATTSFSPALTRMAKRHRLLKNGKVWLLVPEAE